MAPILKPQKWAKLDATLNTVLSSLTANSFVSSMLDDYSSVSKKGEPKKSKLTARSVFKGLRFGLRFAVTHPIHTTRLLRSIVSKAYIDKDFQQHLLQKPEVWSFIRKDIADKLPQIGNLAAKRQILIFQEGSILDAKGISYAQSLLRDTDTETLKSIALGAIGPNPNLPKAFFSALTHPDRGEAFKITLQTQAKEGLLTHIIQGYLNQNENSVNEEIIKQRADGDSEDKLPKSLKTKIAEYGITPENIKNLLDVFPILLDKPKDLQKIFNSFSDGNFPDMAREITSMASSNEPLQTYLLKNNTLFTQIGVKAADIEGYKIDTEVTKIFAVLAEGENKVHIDQLLGSYQKQDFTGLIKNACTLMDESESFKKYLVDNKENFTKIIEVAIDKIPQAKSWGNYLGIEAVGRSAVANIVQGIVNNPLGFKAVVEGYEAEGAAGAAKAAAGIVAKETLLHPITTAISVAGAGKTAAIMAASSAYSSAYNWIKGERQQDIASTAIKKLSEFRVAQGTGEKISVSAFLRQEIAGIPPEKISLKHKFSELVDKKTLFIGSSIVNVQLDNLEFDGQSFINTQISNASFHGTVFKNTNFTGASLSGVDFKGATIDADTLGSMVDCLKKSQKDVEDIGLDEDSLIRAESRRVKLDGIKIVGDLSGIDLSGVDLRGVDLSGVTGMRITNLNETNLQGSILPAKKILSETVNLDKASSTQIDAAAIISQKLKLIETTVDIIDAKSSMQKGQKTDLKNKLIELYTSGSEIGKHIIHTLESTPGDLLKSDFPQDPSKVSHVLDYKDRASTTLTTLYESIEHPETIADKIAADLIAGKLTEKLFQDGTNRGQDGLLIKRTINDAMEEFKKANPNVTSEQILKDPKLEIALTSMSDEIKKHTKYTTAGYATSGIYLPEAGITTELTNRLQTQMNTQFGQYKFNEAELTQIDAISDQIGVNLFASGVKGARAHDVELIRETLKEVFVEIKREKNQTDISDSLATKAKDTSDESISGWTGPTRTGVTKLFYENSSYTTAGLASGGIYLNPNKINGKVFLEGLKSELAKDIPDDRAAKNLPVAVTTTPLPVRATPPVLPVAVTTTPLPVAIAAEATAIASPIAASLQQGSHGVSHLSPNPHKAQKDKSPLLNK